MPRKKLDLFDRFLLFSYFSCMRSFLLFFLFGQLTYAQYAEIKRASVNEVIIVHCIKHDQLNVSVDTGNILHLNDNHQIGYLDFKTDLEIEGVIEEFKAVGFTLVNLCRPVKENDSVTTIAFRKKKVR